MPLKHPEHGALPFPRDSEIVVVGGTDIHFEDIRVTLSDQASFSSRQVVCIDAEEGRIFRRSCVGVSIGESHSMAANYVFEPYFAQVAYGQKLHIGMPQRLR